MTVVSKAGSNDTSLLSGLARSTFLQSHGRSAPLEDIENYITEKYSEKVLERELSEPANIYHLLYYREQAAGYSKIIFNTPYPGSEVNGFTKLERLYLLDTYHGLGVGSELLTFNSNLAKQNGQLGMWLYVWKENSRAVQFYKKSGFVIIGSYDFKISGTHSNPNHQMLLRFQ